MEGRAPVIPTLHFPHGSELFEVNRNRELRAMSWVAFGNDLSNYIDIMDRPNGAAVFGCFVILVLIASRSKTCWHLVDHLGRPYSAAALSRLSRLPVDVMEETIALLIELGVLAAIIPQCDAVIPHPSAAKPHARNVTNET
jgi:hypothetical protein